MCDQDQLPASPGYGDIQTAVVEDKAGSTRSDERKDHDIAFASLESFDCIDRHIRTIQHLPKQNHLRAKWRNDADRGGGYTLVVSE